MKHLVFIRLLSIILVTLACPYFNGIQTALSQNTVSDMVWQSLSKELDKGSTEPSYTDTATTAALDTSFVISIDSMSSIIILRDSAAYTVMLQDSTSSVVILRDSMPSAPVDTVMSYLRWSLPLVFDSHHVPVTPKWDNCFKVKQLDIPQSWKGDSMEISINYMDSLRSATLSDLAVKHICQTEYNVATLPKVEKIEVMLERPSKKDIKAVPTGNVGVSLPVSYVPTQNDYHYTNWKFAGRFSVQASQTYISPNWSSGGTTNNTVLLSAYATANYNDRKLIQFDNVFDLQLGFNTNASDTIRKLSVGTDQLQISSKLGIKAFDRWYYSLQAELITQVADNYNPNTYDLKSSFLSPAKFFVSLGLDYKLSNQKMNLSVLMTPLTYKLNYVREIDKIDPTSYGIKDGEHFGHEFGVKLSSTFNWTIAENVAWSTYFYYYSNFGYIDSEWKNTFNFTINRFLTAQVFIHTKYDDRIKKKEGQKTLLQFKDIVSIGFTYHFPSFRFQ